MTINPQSLDGLDAAQLRQKAAELDRQIVTLTTTFDSEVRLLQADLREVAVRFHRATDSRPGGLVTAGVGDLAHAANFPGLIEGTRAAMKRKALEDYERDHAEEIAAARAKSREAAAEFAERHATKRGTFGQIIG
jgi:hypothetical protein